VRVARVLAAVTVAGVAAGCGTGGQELVVLPPTAHPATKVAPPATAAPTTGPRGKPHVTVQPASGLHDGDSVHVTGTGFTPGNTYIVAQCGDKGSKTGQGDCDITAVLPATADATGTVQVDYTVKKGPFGAHNIVCSPTQPCLINVSQPTPDPTQQADARIVFAG